MRHLKRLVSGCLGQGERRPILLELRSSQWFITAAVCTAIFTDIFLYAVIVPVFPYSLQSRVGLAENQVQHWLSILLAVYGAGLLVGSPIFGVLADRIEYRRTPLLLGLLAVAGSTVMLCLAKSLALLIVGRLLQGLAASVIWVVGMALLADTVGKDEIARSLGYLGTSVSMGTLLAPLLGGVVYEKAGYTAVFGMCFGVIALDIVFRFTLIEKKAAGTWLDEHPNPEDVSPAHEKQSPAMRTVSTIEEGTRQTVPSITIKPSSKRRLPPIFTLFASKRMATAAWGNFVLSTFLCGLDTTLTLFLSRTFNYNSLQSGILFLAVLVPIFGQPLVGYFVDKYGGRWFTTVGFLMMIPPWVSLRFVTYNSLDQKVLLCALLVLIGTGVSVSMCGLMAEFSKICDEEEERNPGAFGKHGAYAQSYSIFNMAWAAGSLVGAFWSGGVYSAAGFGTMGWSFALLSGISAFPVVLYTGDRKQGDEA